MASKSWLLAVQQLVSVATGDADDVALRGAVNAVVDEFDPADAASTKKAMALLEKAASKVDGRAAQVLDLVIGALVEGGASPDLAWPAVSKALPEILGRAAKFAKACLAKARTTGVDEALASAASAVAAERPKEASAWRQTPARCLAVVACLARSAKLRKLAAADEKLAAATAPLVDAIDEVSVLVSLLRMVDGETVYAIHPASGTGVTIVAREVVSNLELVVLAALAMSLGKKVGKNVKTELDPVPWTSLAADDGIDWLEAMPADLPLFDGKRVVILRDLTKPRALPLEGPVPGLDAATSTVKPMKPAVVQALLVAMEARATKAATAPKKSSAKKTVKNR